MQPLLLQPFHSILDELHLHSQGIDFVSFVRDIADLARENLQVRGIMSWLWLLFRGRPCT
jgi:hypothetical protein